MLTKYEDLAEGKIDYEEIEKTIEYIFKEKIKSKSDIGKEFSITSEEYRTLIEDFNFVKDYCSKFGYRIETFYDKSMNPHFYIKFII